MLWGLSGRTMRVAVVGAGVVGMCAASYLRRAGAEPCIDPRPYRIDRF
jgi:glycine/D-amino acid oxidase-like deaminating enzyme